MPTSVMGQFDSCGLGFSSPVDSPTISLASSFRSGRRLHERSGVIRSPHPKARLSRPWRIVGTVLIVAALVLAFKPNYVLFQGRRRFCGVGILIAFTADPWPVGVQNGDSSCRGPV